MSVIGVGPEVGYQRITSSSVIGDANKPIALYGYIIKSTGTAANPTFNNGNSTVNTAVFDDQGTVSTTKVVPLAAAITFPSGLYVTTDANTTYIVAIYRQVLS